MANFKMDYAKVLAIAVATFQAIQSAAEDKEITVKDMFDIAEKMANAMGILEKPILKFGEESQKV